VIRGDIEVGGQMLHAGDAISTEQAGLWRCVAKSDSEALLFAETSIDGGLGIGRKWWQVLPTKKPHQSGAAFL
jgi:hypothetical protein